MESGPDRSRHERGEAAECLAAQALDWLIGSAKHTESGLTWPVSSNHDDVDPTMYSGAGGNILALLDAQHHFRDDRYGDAAIRAAQALAAEVDGQQDCSMFFGLTGTAVALQAAATQLGQTSSSASRALALVRQRFDGQRWSQMFELLAGNAGIGLGALHAGDVELALLAATPYVAAADATSAGVNWAVRPSPARSHHIAHGTLGIVYALATVGSATGRRDLIELALAGAKDVVSRNEAGPDGFSMASRAPRAATTTERDIDQTCIDTIRTLAMDAVEQAKSGHPGTPMALAPAAYTLWQRVLRYDPADPTWPNRDRFVLSNGHASMLLYGLLHLAGVADKDRDGPAVTHDDIKRFRQLGSRCPGHPEYGHTAGVEVTTGPLGQGCGNSVGMAIGARWLAGTFNRSELTLFDYNIYTFCSDGDMMEGVASEAASLAGHLKLANLCWVYDNNHITIDGPTGIAFDEEVGRRFEGYGWKVLRVDDANDTEAFARALETFRRTRDRPTFIILDSHIGFGAPHKQDTSAAHGEPFGEDEVRLAKRSYGWPEDAKFLVPEGVYEHFRNGIGKRGRDLHGDWARRFEAYRGHYPELAAQLDAMQRRELPAGWEADIPDFEADPKGVATRESGGKVLNAIGKHYPWLVGGAADLDASTKTALKFDKAGELEPGSPAGRNLHFGIREHCMGAVLNGLALSGLRPFGSTFLIFSDYMRPPIRLAAMMRLPTIYVYTDDSIGLGEDGPTHQPIEQLIGLRAVPGLVVLRPADANEAAEAWRTIIALKEPACLILSRQKLPILDRTRHAPAAGVARGAYVLADAANGRSDVILIGTGSEVPVCLAARDVLEADGIGARVVSMPSWELFDRQEARYRDDVLPPAVKARVAVEAAAALGWERYVGPRGATIGMHGFGASAPANDLMKEFGFTPENVAKTAKAQIAFWRDHGKEPPA